jgi:hypothetical protein
MRRAAVILLVAAGAIATVAGVTHAAAKKRAETSSESIAVTVTLSGGELSSPATIRLTGAVDNARHVASGTVDLSGVPFQLPVQKVDGVIDASHGLVLYARVPLLAQIVAGGKEWASIDAGALARAEGVDLSPLTTLASSPQQFLPTLRSLAAASETLGAGHERLTIDVRKLATLAPAAHRAEAAACIEAAIAAGAPATVPVDVWSDASGLLQRVSLSVTGPDGGHADVDVRLGGYGTATAAKPPAAGSVTDLTHFFQGR